MTQAARKRHRVGATRIRHVIATTIPTAITTTSGADAWLYIGPDADGDELEVIAVEQPTQLLVIHAMPTRYRRNP